MYLGREQKWAFHLWIPRKTTSLVSMFQKKFKKKCGTPLEIHLSVLALPPRFTWWVKYFWKLDAINVHIKSLQIAGLPFYLINNTAGQPRYPKGTSRELSMFVFHSSHHDLIDLSRRLQALVCNVCAPSVQADHHIRYWHLDLVDAHCDVLAI